MTSATCCAYPTNYDARGNVTFDGCFNWGVLTYTSFNKPRSIELPGGAREYFSYDAGHDRVRKKSLGARPTGMEWSEVITLGGRFERRKGDAAEDWVYYVHANGRVVGQLTQSRQGGGWGPNNGWEFFYQDRLGSVEVTTNDLGTVRNRMSYGSWGARRNPDGTNENAPASTPQHIKRGFTGHSHDDELHWIDMGGRQYNPYTRRFLQPDPIVADASSGPRWNRYAYVS